MTGMGPGLRACLCTDAPLLSHYLPLSVRLEIVRTFAPPEGGWFVKGKVMRRMPLLLGRSLQRAEIKDGKVRLRPHTANGTEREIAADHTIAATGYRVDLGRLSFLSMQIRSRLKTVEDTPIRLRTSSPRSQASTSPG
jgi:hypothetical protein